MEDKDLLEGSLTMETPCVRNKKHPHITSRKQVLITQNYLSDRIEDI